MEVDRRVFLGGLAGLLAVPKVIQCQYDAGVPVKQGPFVVKGITDDCPYEITYGVHSSEPQMVYISRRDDPEGGPWSDADLSAYLRENQAKMEQELEHRFLYGAKRLSRG